MLKSRNQIWRKYYVLSGAKLSEMLRQHRKHNEEILVSCVCSHRRTTIEWAESHNFPTFSQAKMEDTRFVDLKVKVGFPYLYCHQGDCEHLVIITDIRLVLQGIVLQGFSPILLCP